MATRSSALDSATGAMDITGVTVAAMEVTVAVAEGVTAIADFYCGESKRGSENVFLVS